MLAGWHRGPEFAIALPVAVIPKSIVPERRSRAVRAGVLQAAVLRVPAPVDYYNGSRRPPLVLPDNLLLFVRRRKEDLRDGTFLPHYHHRWVLVVPVRGSGDVVVDGRAHPLRPGQLLLVPPLRLHRYARIPRRGLLWLFVTFELPGGPGLVEAAARGRLTPEAEKALAALLRLWVTGRGTESRPNLAARMALEVSFLVGEVVRAQPRRTTSAWREPAMLGRINRWIGSLQGGGEPRAALGALARHVGLSESRLRAWFRASFGISLGRYIRETRCRRAAQRLREGGMSVAEAAEAFGFGSAFSFSRTFKAVLGMPPSDLLPRSAGPGGAGKRRRRAARRRGRPPRGPARTAASAGSRRRRGHGR
jgi:AraC family transcriptional regulator